MAKPETIFHPKETPLATGTKVQYKEQLKSHLRWCAYLASSVDRENMSDLSDMLRDTAQTMSQLAKLAKQYQNE